MKRERTSLWVMAYGVYVHYSALSLRKASSILEPVQRRSHEAIRQSVAPEVLLPRGKVPGQEGLRAFHPDRRDHDTHRGEGGMGLDRLRAPSQAVPWLQDLLLEEHLGRLLLHPAPPLQVWQEADLDGRRDLVSRGLQVGPHGAPRLPNRMEELHGAPQPDLQGQGRMLRRLLPLLEGGVQ